MSSPESFQRQVGDESPVLGDVDASFRWVAMFFTAKAAFWLLVGSFLTLFASIKLHAPAMLAGKEWLTYGRIAPAGWDALLYGFAGQAGFALGLWVIARACRQRLQAPILVIAGGICWNIGVLIGVIAILLGESTGRELLEMPLAVMGLLTVAGALIGISGWVTFAQRTEERTYPSPWFVLLALLAFVWCSFVAIAMYSGEGVRGVVQVLVQRWYATGILKLWISGLTLGILFHFLPVLVNRPLASRALAIWAFWTMVLFTPFGVTGHGDPFPRWLVSLGLAGQTLSVIAIVSIALNWWQTLQGTWRTLFSTPSGVLLGVSAISFVSWGVLRYLISFPAPSALLRLTWIEAGLDWLLVGCSATLAALALLPEFLYRATGRSLPVGMVRLHGWLTMAGVVIIAVSLLLAGLVQGLGLSSESKTFMQALGGSLHLVRLSSLGVTLLFVAQIIYGLALMSFFRAVVGDWVQVGRGWFAPVVAKSREARL